MMPTAQLRRLARNRLTIDTHAIILAGVLVGVATLSVLIAQHLTATTPPPDVPASIQDSSTGKANATGGGLWVIIEIAAASILIGSLFAYKKAPEWLQTAVRRATIFSILALIGAMLAVTGLFWNAIPLLVGGYIVAKAADHHGLYWLINNALSIGLATVTAVIIARLAGPLAIAIALVGLTVYDHVFANQHEWMVSMALPAVKWKLPVLFVLPTTLRFDWTTLLNDETTTTDNDRDADGNDGDGGVHGLGTADIALPAGFVASIAVSELASAVVLASVVSVGVAVAAFRLRYLMEAYSDSRGGAGLPSITTGALGAFAVGYVVIGVVG